MILTVLLSVLLADKKYNCKKIRYNSILEAKKFMKKINIKFKSKGIEPLKSWYRCEKCNGYHLATNRSAIIKQNNEKT